MRHRFDFQSMLSDAIGDAMNRVSIVMLWDSRPYWLQRLQQGHVLPWMLPTTKNRTQAHARRYLHRRLCTLRMDARHRTVMA